jgi:hypothetical protein
VCDYTKSAFQNYTISLHGFTDVDDGQIVVSSNNTEWFVTGDVPTGTGNVSYFPTAKNIFKTMTCPENEPEVGLLFIMVLIVLVLLVVSLLIKNGWLGVLAGMGAIILSLQLFMCHPLYGLFMLGLGMLELIYSATMENF